MLLLLWIFRSRFLAWFLKSPKLLHLIWQRIIVHVKTGLVNCKHEAGWNKILHDFSNLLVEFRIF